jgi:hypothetical protein
VGTQYHRTRPDQFHNKIKPNSPLTARPAGVLAGLIFLNAPTGGCRHETGMPHSSTTAKRLLAPARICRKIANTTLNAQTARELELPAADCIRAARDAEPASRFQRFQRPATRG